MSRRNVLLGALALLLVVLPSVGQTSKPAADPQPAAAAPSPEEAALLKSTEAYVRTLFGWGSQIKVTVGPLAQSPAPDFYTVPIEVTLNDHKENGEVYVSKDGKTLLRGQLYDMRANPFADNLAKIRPDGSPSKGPADAESDRGRVRRFRMPALPRTLRKPPGHRGEISASALRL